MKNYFTPVFALFFLGITTCVYSQGKLSDSKDDLKGKRGSSHHNSEDSHSHSTHGGSILGEILWELAARAILYTTYYSTIGSYEYEQHLHSNLSPYPYHDGSEGNYLSIDLEPTEQQATRFDLSGNYLYHGESMSGVNFGLKIRPSRYFYLKTNYLNLNEKIVSTNSTDKLTVLGAYACYDRLRFSKFNLGWMLGVNYVGNEVRQAGFALGVNAELFVSKPVSFEFSQKWAFINQAMLNETMVNAKYHLRNYFASAGYQHFKIGSPQYDFVTVGLGVYF